jgi:hypothetical protein
LLVACGFIGTSDPVCVCKSAYTLSSSCIVHAGDKDLKRAVAAGAEYRM